MLERMKRRFKQQSGFTLVELLAVLAILGIVLAIAVPSVSGVISNSEDEADKSNRELMENAARLAHTSEFDSDSENDEGNDKTTYKLNALVNDGFLEEVPKNPKTDSEYNGTVEMKNKSNESGDEVDSKIFEYVPGDGEKPIGKDTGDSETGSGGDDQNDGKSE